MLNSTFRHVDGQRSVTSNSMSMIVDKPLMDGAQAVARHGANFKDGDRLLRVVHHIVQSHERSEKVALHPRRSVDFVQQNQDRFLSQMRRGQEFEHLNAGGAYMSSIGQIDDVNQRARVFQIVLPYGRHASSDFP